MCADAVLRGVAEERWEGGDGQRERSWRHASFLERHKLLPALTLMATRSHARRACPAATQKALRHVPRMTLYFDIFREEMYQLY